MTSIIELDLDPQMLERKRKVLPLVMRIRSNIDELFIRFVGPVGDAICEDCFNQWAASGSIGPSGLRRYIDMIAKDIPDPGKSQQFKKMAVSLIRLI
jgi:hypothetical protein